MKDIFTGIKKEQKKTAEEKAAQSLIAIGLLSAAVGSGVAGNAISEHFDGDVQGATQVAAEILLPNDNPETDKDSEKGGRELLLGLGLLATGTALAAGGKITANDAKTNHSNVTHRYHVNPDTGKFIVS